MRLFRCRDNIAIFVDHGLFARLGDDHGVALGVEISLVTVFVLIIGSLTFLVSGVFMAVLGNDGGIAGAVFERFVSILVALN